MQNSKGALRKIVCTRMFSGPEKIEVETTSGLLTVNGVRTTSLCDNHGPIRSVQFGPNGVEFEKVFKLLRDGPGKRMANVLTGETACSTERNFRLLDQPQPARAIAMRFKT